jgi:hypothetical protein
VLESKNNTPLQSPPDTPDTPESSSSSVSSLPSIPSPSTVPHLKPPSPPLIVGSGDEFPPGSPSCEDEDEPTSSCGQGFEADALDNNNSCSSSQTELKLPNSESSRPSTNSSAPDIVSSSHQNQVNEEMEEEENAVEECRNNKDPDSSPRR